MLEKGGGKDPLQTMVNVLPTRKLKTIFHQQETSYNTILVLLSKIMQHIIDGIVQYWHQTQFHSNTGKFTKMVHPDFFGDDMVVGIFITLTYKINDCR